MKLHFLKLFQQYFENVCSNDRTNKTQSKLLSAHPSHFSRGQHTRKHFILRKEQEYYNRPGVSISKTLRNQIQMVHGITKK